MTILDIFTLFLSIAAVYIIAIVAALAIFRPESRELIIIALQIIILLKLRR